MCQVRIKNFKRTRMRDPVKNDEADLLVENGAAMLRPVERPRREGWAESSRNIATSGDEELIWLEFGDTGDETLKW